nr:hypothetical protein [uncultured Pseudodesulfovibrio sp.]
MQRTMYRQLCVLCLTGLFLILAGTVGASDQPARNTTGIICPNSAEPIGLVMDSRSNVYTACGMTGQIFCLPPGGDPVSYAEVEGTLTALAVDSRRILYIGTESGQIHAITLDGSVHEVHRCTSRIIGLSADRDGGLIIAMGNGTVVTVEREELEWGKK